jgi:hypothetical protein
MQGNGDKTEKPQPKATTSAFEIDTRICMNIEYELAVNLGKLVLESDTKNTALLALGHQLRNLAKKASPEI